MCAFLYNFNANVKYGTRIVSDELVHAYTIILLPKHKNKTISLLSI